MSNAITRRIKAVIFDLDDTLVESTVNYPKFKQLVIEQIAAWGEPRADYSPNETVVAIIARYEARVRSRGMTDPEIRSRLRELDSIMDQVELERVSETHAIGGAVELLSLLRRKGIKVGILTRGCQAYTDAALDTTGMASLVDAVECRNSDTRPKPSPEAYLKLVTALGVPKESTAFVGDHPIDAQCARNAGVPFIAVLTGDVPEEVLKEAGSVEVFADVGELVDWFEEVLPS